MQATFLTGFDTTKRVFEAYRRGWREAGRGRTPALRRPGLSLPVRLVWAARADDGLHCGVAIDASTSATTPWYSLVDAIQ